MRIAIVDPSLFTIPYDRELCQALVELGHDVYFFSRPLRTEEALCLGNIPHKTVFYPLAERLRSLPRTVYLWIKGAEHLLSMSRFETLLKAIQPDVVHFQWLPLPTLDRYAMNRLKRRLPLVLTVHDSVPYNGCPSSRVQTGHYKDLLSSFQRLIVHTDQAVARLSSMGIASEKVVTIPHGLLNVGPQWETRKAITEARDQGSKAESLGKGPVVFLVLGKIKPYKGIDTLIKAAARMPEPIRKKCRFVIAGQPCMDVDGLKAMCAKYGLESYFHFECRYLTDEELHVFMKRSSAMVFPYREIDASGVLMACLPYGLPIVASELGVFKQMLTDGEHGRLVPVDAPAALARALGELASDAGLRRRASDAVLRLSAAVPQWKRIAELTATVYNRAIEEHDQGERIATLHLPSQKSKALP